MAYGCVKRLSHQDPRAAVELSECRLELGSLEDSGWKLTAWVSTCFGHLELFCPGKIARVRLRSG